MGLEQSALKDDEWALSYDVTELGMIIYLTKGKNLIRGEFKPVAKREVDDLVRKFRQPLELGSGESLPKNLVNLISCRAKSSLIYFWPISSLDTLLLASPNAPVIIVPDGSLGVVPFEMLVLECWKASNRRQDTSDFRRRVLRDRNPISYYQSITALTLAWTLGKPPESG